MATIRNRRSLSPRKPKPPAEHASDAQIKIFLESYEETLSRFTARKAAGITRQMMWEILKRPEVIAQMAETLEEGVDRVEEAAFTSAIMKGDKDSQKLILQAKRAATYGPKATLNVQVDITQLTKDELKAFIEENSKRR